RHTGPITLDGAAAGYEELTCHPLPGESPCPREYPAHGASAGERPAEDTPHVGAARQGHPGSQRHGDSDLHSETDGLNAVIARAATYVVVAILVAGALYELPQLPEKRPAEELLRARQQRIADIPLAMLRERIDTLASGESVRGVFAGRAVTAVRAGQ